MSHRLRPAILILAALLPLGAHAADDRPRTVSVTGSGEVSASPDLAQVTLGVEARAPTLAAARSTVAASVEKVLALTRSLGIDPKLVNATRLQVQPDYSWDDPTRKRTLVGYVVGRQVQVELRDLEQLGPLLERAVDAGVNQVGDPALDSSRRKDLEREAMTRAVNDARQNAETLAKAAGVRLGPVRTLNGGGAPPPMPMFRQVAMDAAAAPAPAPEATYQTGELRFTASVSAEYDLLVGP